MARYEIKALRIENDNTAEFGYGDFPKWNWDTVLTVEADTVRQAQAKAKKVFGKRFLFGGVAGARVKEVK